MAYFTQAGTHQAFSQSGFQAQEPASGGSYRNVNQSQATHQAAHQAQTAAPQQGGMSTAADGSYQGPGTESYAQSAYDSDLYAAPSHDFGAQGQASYVPPSAKRDWSRSLGLLGGAASLVLTIGVGYWGYNLITRDVTGIPVVRAAEGPLRVSPEAPGGRPADNQGLAVNAVAATGTAAAPADRLTLAPESFELSEDDVAFAQLSQVETLNRPADLQLETAQVLDETTPTRVAATSRSGDINALVAQLTDGVEPIATPDEPSGTTRVALASAAPAIVQPEPLTQIEPVIASAVLNAPGVRVSLRPSVRPARLAPASLSTSVSSTASLQAVDVDPKSLPAGTRLAQLGAYESAEVARTEWTRISARFSDYLDGKQRVIQRAESGGRTFYRLRAHGFADLSDARRFCSALVAGRADCIPVTIR